MGTSHPRHGTRRRGVKDRDDGTPRRPRVRGLVCGDNPKDKGGTRLGPRPWTDASEFRVEGRGTPRTDTCSMNW